MLADVPRAAQEAVELAARQRARARPEPGTDTVWLPHASCHLQLTHVPLLAPAEAVPALAGLFFSASRLPAQPWYEGFRGGALEPLGVATVAPVLRAALALSVVEVGLPAPRAYRSLVAEVAWDGRTRVTTLGAIDEGPSLPEGAVLAQLLPPSGDVFHHDGQLLHWHHLMVTPGVGLWPDWVDHALLRTLRSLKLDGAERASYRREAEALTRFLPELERFTRAHGVTVLR